MDAVIAHARRQIAAIHRVLPQHLQKNRGRVEDCDEYVQSAPGASSPPIRRLYTHADLPEDWNYEKYLGYPGQPPFTRGIHASGYRGKLFTMRQFSGFASPEETNQRYKYLLDHGGGGLSVAFDLPTLMGYDSDHAASEGEVGKCGVAIDSLEDMEILFGGIDLRRPPYR